MNETVPGSDILGQDPQLGALAANGGPTQTMKPAATSPVVDQGSAFGLGTDQRGLARPFDAPTIPNSGGDASDIGAVELQASEVPPVPPAAAAPVQAKKKKCKKKKHKRSAESAKKKCKKKKKRH